ncbi:MAG: hypothetical protein Pg6B_04500 [Candidatus Azobacteroides pseudotrichonymphae]|uniref:Uncharacterized protein n=1 Tax=Candidatus Improbicoccus pseudotrichonymphae TaxID=3033792 RepID=A0AA48HUN9_9FIRM|nr:MAG: hypothetical protein CfP315_0208 [Candidatus Improbicoccus pseudotrichonymphae]GMO34093.1 MAG: hypothetical protein Pg6B_04500 [Candidatus Azobacteroides pseudotrichonymphae]
MLIKNKLNFVLIKNNGEKMNIFSNFKNKAICDNEKNFKTNSEGLGWPNPYGNLAQNIYTEKSDYCPYFNIRSLYSWIGVGNFHGQTFYATVCIQLSGKRTGQGLRNNTTGDYYRANNELQNIMNMTGVRRVRGLGFNPAIGSFWQVIKIKHLLDMYGIMFLWPIIILFQILAIFQIILLIFINTMYYQPLRPFHLKSLIF